METLNTSKHEEENRFHGFFSNEDSI